MIPANESTVSLQLPTNESGLICLTLLLRPQQDLSVLELEVPAESRPSRLHTPRPLVAGAELGQGDRGDELTQL